MFLVMELLFLTLLLVLDSILHQVLVGLLLEIYLLLILEKILVVDTQNRVVNITIMTHIS